MPHRGGLRRGQRSTLTCNFASRPTCLPLLFPPPKKKNGERGGGLLRGPPSSPPPQKKKRKEKGGGDECKHSRGILLTMRRAEVLTSLFVFSILVHLCLGGDAHHLCRSLLDAADDTSMIRILLRDFFAGYQKKCI